MTGKRTSIYKRQKAVELQNRFLFKEESVGRFIRHLSRTTYYFFFNVLIYKNLSNLQVMALDLVRVLYSRTRVRFSVDRCVALRCALEQNNLYQIALRSLRHLMYNTWCTSTDNVTLMERVN